MNTIKTPYVKRIFVAGLNGRTQKAKILSFFNSRYPGCTRVDLPHRKDKKGISKGFAILFLENDDDYDQILKKKDFIIEGRLVHARPFKKGKELATYKQKFNMRKLYVRNIPDGWGKGKLRECFVRFGAIEDSYIIHDPETGKKLNFGFVIFMEEAPAKKLLDQGFMVYEGVRLHLSHGLNPKKAQDFSRDHEGSKTTNTRFLRELNARPVGSIESADRISSAQQVQEQRNLINSVLGLLNFGCNTKNQEGQIQPIQPEFRNELVSGLTPGFSFGQDWSQNQVSRDVRQTRETRQRTEDQPRPTNPRQANPRQANPRSRPKRSAEREPPQNNLPAEEKAPNHDIKPTEKFYHEKSSNRYTHYSLFTRLNPTKHSRVAKLKMDYLRSELMSKDFTGEGNEV